MPNHYPGYLFIRWIVAGLDSSDSQDSNLALFFGKLSTIERLSEIKPILTINDRRIELY